MKLTQIEYFLAVAQTLNFTSAAKKLYISQPALSRQIAAIEEELGVPLFLRTSRKVLLTPAGMQLKQDLADVMVQVERAKERAVEIGKTPPPALRVGCMEGPVFDDCIQTLAQCIRDLDPNIQLQFTRCPPQDCLDGLRKDRFDLLLTLEVSLTPEPEELVIKLRRGTVALVYAVASPLAGKEPLEVEDFAGEPFLVLSSSASPTLYQNSLRSMKQLGIAPPEVREMDNLSSLITNLRLGGGYALLSRDILRANPGLWAFLPEPLEGAWVIAVCRREHPIAELLQKHLRKHFRA